MYQRWLFHACILTFLTAVSVLILVPFIWMFVISLHVPSYSFVLPPQWFKGGIRWENYFDVFKNVPFALYMLNSMKVTVIIIAGQIFTSSLAAYAFARLYFHGKHILFTLLLSAMMIPLFVTIIPTFVFIRMLQLTDTHASLIIPAMITPFGVFLLRQFFLTIPRELEDAAKIDGATPWQIFWIVFVPLGKPGIIVLALINFNAHWNEFFRPLIFLNSWEQFTLPLGIVTLRGFMDTGSISVVLAGISLAILPVVTLFILAQRHLFESLVITGVKG
ncbi:MAG: carbohydrate ABC transporter permease [Chloroflexi bacterium AL-W]|nr:carbohydrate ABC transporter permease [Chloroflexi bacterium AL-N1]NOK71213.1 carbohydrate ABC transporter permease [Chloroflexi bacterium AL-N10]NOK76502.1 carbohydrate ABC transporter permease [Chloroflexi bacterium AL-N5]NOK83619.1 carbohydrate ABC transporter permease [Chloroflexi bacterium AL-W]NOK92259.1 carbohydrate ABC transporter permease [Chloroflexi bacterium AL-N15]